MADVFISYDHNDKDRISFLVSELEKGGLTVWWDRRIMPGDTFQPEIQEEINKSESVLVVWSESSVRSDWVRAEAMMAFDKKTLISVRLDDVQVPIPFNIQNVVNLINWPHEADDKEIAVIIESLSAKKHATHAKDAMPRPVPAREENLSIRLARRVVQAFDTQEIPTRAQTLKRQLRYADLQSYLNANAQLNQFTLQSVQRAWQQINEISKRAARLPAVFELKQEITRYAALLGDSKANTQYAELLQTARADNSNPAAFSAELEVLDLPAAERTMADQLAEPDDKSIYCYATHILMPMGELDLASKYYRIAIRANPINALPRFQLARASVALGEWLEALEALESCMHLAPNAWFYRLFHAYVGMLLGNLSTVELALNSLDNVKHPLINLVGRFLEDEELETDYVLTCIDSMFNTLWSSSYTLTLLPEPELHEDTRHTLQTLRNGAWRTDLQDRANQLLASWKMS